MKKGEHIVKIKVQAKRVSRATTKKSPATLRITVTPHATHHGTLLNLRTRTAQQESRHKLTEYPEGLPVISLRTTSLFHVREIVGKTRVVFQSQVLRGLGAFTLVALLIIIPFHALVAYQSLQQAQGSVLGVSVGTGVAHVGWERRIDEISNSLQQLNPLVRALVALTPQGREGVSMLTAGHALAAVIEDTKSLQEVWSSGVWSHEKIQGIQQTIHDIAVQMTAANESLISVKGTFVPDSLQTLFREAQDAVPRLALQLQHLDPFVAHLDTVLGFHKPQRYLFVFQNQHELRATGGFIGSFAIVEFKDGAYRIVQMPSFGSYALDRSLTKLSAPPAPLRVVIDKMTFHDANWDPDFSTSARNLLYWYEQSGGESLDGVIALNAAVVEHLLSVVGPIDIPELSMTITADNFTASAEQYAALPRSTSNPPKALLTVLAPHLLSKLTSVSSTEQALSLLMFGTQALAQRDIQLYHTDIDIQNAIATLGYSGELLPVSPQQDYVFPVFSNIGGWKTDQVVETVMTLDTNLDNNGSITHTITITRKHNGVERGPEGTTQENKSYVRIYVPEGSVLGRVVGFSPPPQETGETVAVTVTKEHGKTVFSGWVMTPRGEERAVTLTWTTPQFTGRDASAYQLVIQKQSGLEHTTLQTQYTGRLLNPAMVEPTIARGVENIPFVQDMLITIPFTQ